MDFEKLVKSRKSVHSFSDKKPDWRDIIECIDNARYIPTAGKNFILKFMLVQDKENIQKIANAAEQDFIAKAHYLIAVYSDNKRLKILFGDKKGEIYSRHEAGAAIQTILLSIQDHGLSGCWVGHFDKNEIKTILKIPEKMELEAIIPVGYEFKKTKPKERIKMDNILYFDKHEKSQMRKPYSPQT